MKDLDTDEKSLANWWSNSITTHITTSLNPRCDANHSDDDDDTTEINDNKKLLVNLASDEYSSAIDTAMMDEHNYQFIKVVFRQEGRVIAVHAKRARGLMVRYICENQLGDVDDIKAFDLEGYSFDGDKSDETTLVFDRPKNYGKNSKGKDGTKTSRAATNKRAKSPQEVASSTRSKRSRDKS